VERVVLGVSHPWKSERAKIVTFEPGAAAAAGAGSDPAAGSGLEADPPLAQASAIVRLEARAR
jgi:hypothetical protein